MIKVQNITYLDSVEAYAAQLEALHVDDEHAPLLGQHQQPGGQVHLSTERAPHSQSACTCPLQTGAVAEAEAAMQVIGGAVGGSGGVSSGQGATAGGVGVQQLHRHGHAVLSKRSRTKNIGSD